MTHVAIVEDDPVLGASIVQRLRLEGYAPVLYADGRSALAGLAKRPPALVLCDIRLPDLDGETLMREAFGAIGAVPTIFMTAFGDFGQAVRLVRQGARDYLPKPFDLDDLVERIGGWVDDDQGGRRATAGADGARGAATAYARRAADGATRGASGDDHGAKAAAGADDEPVRSRTDAVPARRAVHTASGTAGAGAAVPPGGRSPAMARVRALLERAARVDTPVLLTGETGTGKEMAARYLGACGRGAGKPFVAVNAAALAPDLALSQLFGHEKGAFTGASERRIGFVEAAGEGTLFLDEVGELSPAVQGKLLRLLEDRTFVRVGGTAPIACRARFVFATNRDLAREAAEGRFREDLLFRIRVIELPLPPLRARPDEIDDLLEDFVGSLSERLGRTPTPEIPATVRAAARAYGWPGNVRELRNRVERAIALGEGPHLTVEDLFPDLPHGPVPEPSAQSGGATATAADDAVAGDREAVVGATAAGAARWNGDPPVVDGRRATAAGAPVRLPPEAAAADPGPRRAEDEGGEPPGLPRDHAGTRAAPAAAPAAGDGGVARRAAAARGDAETPAARPVEAHGERSAGDGGEDPISLADARQRAEADHIRRVLARTGHHLGETARLLGISRTTLWEKIRAYDLDGR